jgi:hypothetical protein
VEFAILQGLGADNSHVTPVNTENPYWSKNIL